MFIKALASVAFITAIAAPALAKEPSPQPSLASALVSVGNHGSAATATATAASPNSFANVNANLLGGAVRANVAVDQSSRQGNTLLGIGLDLDGGVGNRH